MDDTVPNDSSGMNASLMKKQTLATLAALLLSGFLTASLGRAAETVERPNIVIFLTDDQSQRDLSPYADRGIRTPNMQRLADGGLVFDRAYVASPSCAPSRAALLTGLMPARNGAELNHAKPNADLKTWPAYFQDLGYEVVAFGKVSHYNHTADYGFDFFAHDTFHDHRAIPAAVEFLKKRDPATAKPLCLMVGSNWPHVPWPRETAQYDSAALVLPPGSVETPETYEWRARYAAAVTKADEDLGAVYEAVVQTLGEETLFLFSSDHGAQWPFAKWNVYEAGIRVPLIVSWPGRVKPGSRSGAMVSWIDFLPTMLEAAGGEAPDGLDGRSFLPVMEGATDQHRDRIFATHAGDGRWNIYPARSLRIGQWKLILNLRPEFAFTTHIDLPGDLGQRDYWSTWEEAAKTDPEAAAIVTRYHKRPAMELYDLLSDPHEQVNLATAPDQADRVERMHEVLGEWMRAQNDRETHPNEPRLLSDPDSWGPNGYSGNAPRRQTPRTEETTR